MLHARFSYGTVYLNNVTSIQIFKSNQRIVGDQRFTRLHPAAQQQVAAPGGLVLAGGNAAWRKREEVTEAHNKTPSWASVAPVGGLHGPLSYIFNLLHSHGAWFDECSGRLSRIPTGLKPKVTCAPKEHWSKRKETYDEVTTGQ
jgi:hypothetical protein